MPGHLYRFGDLLGDHACRLVLIRGETQRRERRKKDRVKKMVDDGVGDSHAEIEFHTESAVSAEQNSRYQCVDGYNIRKGLFM